MRNKAKCRLCNTVIESFHSTDYVSCSCSEIAVDGGDAMRCYAKDFKNFIRVDDNNNEVEVRFSDTYKEHVKEEKIDKKQAIKEMIDRIESLSDSAKSVNLNHYDMLSILYLMLSE